ncbi:hypothetical protein MAR_038012 [Mya arenaria]|uniref:Calpain catalytic domain-containing protein n=1 Tax=Mya arenaria TaxID=6604 RepID=A0ABY7FQ51_MYAAR|nr:hypothetical protein MAR_038012 [Mya arenaria]
MKVQGYKEVPSMLTCTSPSSGINPVGKNNPGACFPKEPQIQDALQGKQNNWKDVDVSLDDAVLIENTTRTQSDSVRWHEERHKRITASYFGAIMTRQKTVNEPFMKKTFNRPNLQNQANVLWPFNPVFQYLGASPDGIICKDAWDMTISEAVRDLKGFFLIDDGDTIRLKKLISITFRCKASLRDLYI